MTYSEALKNCIFRFTSGSHAYGTNVPTSDVDVRGVFIAPLKYAFALFQTSFVGQGNLGEKLSNVAHALEEGDWASASEQLRQAREIDQGDLNLTVGTVSRTDTDEELQELRKFVKLAADNNPNITEALYVDRMILFEAPVWSRIRENRNLFLSKKAKFTFSGYALSQLKRIKVHRGYLLNPPKGKPERKAFGLPEGSAIPRESQNAILSIPDEYIEESSKDVVRREKAFQSALADWNAYRKWQKERNPKRKELEAKHGYDCYVEETEFLTDNGFKKFSEVKDVDNLATFNPVTFDLEYQKPIDKFRGSFTGNLYCLYGTHLDVKVTPNHRIFYRKKERSCKKYEWKLDQASTLPDTFQILRSITPKYKNYSEKDLFKNLRLNPINYLRLMGWYLSDGCCNFHENGSVKTIRISQKKGGKLHWSMSRFYGENKKRISCGLYFSKRKANRFNSNSIIEVILIVSDESIRNKMFEDCSCRSKKRIPRWVFSLSKRKMDILLDALINGDGYRGRPKDGIIYYSKSHQLASDVQELALLCGYETALWGPYLNKKQRCYMYHVHIRKISSQFKTLVRNQNVCCHPVKSRKIVCFTTKNGTLITRLNGKIGLHGNSKHAMHLVRLVRMAKEILRDGVVNIYREDRDELNEIRDGKWPYEKLEQYAIDADKELDVLYETSTLRDKPDHKRIAQLYMDICEDWYGIEIDPKEADSLATP